MRQTTLAEGDGRYVIMAVRNSDQSILEVGYELNNGEAKLYAGMEALKTSGVTGSNKIYVGGSASQMATLLPANVWTHVAGVWNPVNRVLSMYINGVMEFSLTTNRVPCITAASRRKSGWAALARRSGR